MQHNDNKAETYYEILGVTQEASKADIKKGYYNSALAYRPDKNQEAGAEERFKLIAEAYEVLSDEEKKSTYDTNLPYGHAYAKSTIDPRGVQVKKPEIDPTPQAQQFLSELEAKLKNINPETKRKSWLSFGFGKEPREPITELKKLFNDHSDWNTNAQTVQQQIRRIRMECYAFPSNEKNSELNAFYKNTKEQVQQIFNMYPIDRTPARMPPKKGGLSGWS